MTGRVPIRAAVQRSNRGVGHSEAGPAPPRTCRRVLFLVGSALFLIGSYLAVRELSWRPLGGRGVRPTGA